MNRGWLGAVALLSFAAGGAAGYFFAIKQLEEEFDARLEEEILATKKHYGAMKKVETPAEAVERLIPKKEAPEANRAANKYHGIPQRLAGVVAPADPSKLIIKTESIFNKDDLQDLTEADIRNRTEEAPYVISIEENAENENQYAQETVTYYTEDGVLTNDRDERVEDLDSVIGENNLLRFGHGSKDRKVVYVRNDQLEIDYEVLKYEGSYRIIVLGEEPDERAS